MQGHAENFGFIATGIGSVPFLDVEASCREIIESLPHLPFWPQFVKRSFLEDMNVQYSEGLPLLTVNEKNRISGDIRRWTAGRRPRRVL